MKQLQLYVHGFRTQKASSGKLNGNGPVVRKRGFVHVYVFDNGTRLHALHFRAGGTKEECNYLAIKFGLNWLKEHPNMWDSAILSSSSEEAITAIIKDKHHKRLGEALPSAIYDLLGSLKNVELVSHTTGEVPASVPHPTLAWDKCYRQASTNNVPVRI